MSATPTLHRSAVVEDNDACCEPSTSVDAVAVASPPHHHHHQDDDLPDCKVRRNYTCSSCDFFTQNPRVFLYHLRDVHKEKVRIYECPHCLYASKHFQKLLRHAKMVHGDGVDVSQQPQRDAEPSAPSPPNEERRRRDDDVADVDVAEDAGNSRATSFRCSVCDYSALNRTQLSRHEREDHIKTKFFRCSKCTYVTHIKARYTKHVKYHSMPMIKCDMCDFRTPYKWNLDRHCKNHNGRGVFRCSACNFTADIKQSLTVHEMNHHTPPVGQAAGLAAGRRRNKVGASDAAALEDDAEEAADAVVVEERRQPEPVALPRDDHRTPQQNRRRPVDDVPMAKHHHHHHNNNKVRKTARPVPNLIPIPSKGGGATSPYRILADATATTTTMSQTVINDICSKSANSSLKDLASLFGSEDVFKPPPKIVPDLIPARADFKQKNASFFDKLKEKLELGGGTAASNLICSLCGHESKCLTEHVKHQNACGKETSRVHNNVPRLSNLSGSSRCQYCRQRCKSTADLYNHVQTCAEALRRAEEDDDVKLEPIPDLKIEDDDAAEDVKQPHPMENKVFVWNDIMVPMDIEVDDSNYEYTDDRGDETSLDLSVRTQSPYAYHVAENNNNNNNHSKNQVVTTATEKVATHGNDISTAQHKRVFKCPHCTFWASTASRFHVHIVGHLNKKPFECSLCSYRSNWRWDITKHIKLKSVRDQAHETARVLMTDETGRRNYTKYNKYLTEIPLSSLHSSSETSGGCGTRPRHLEKITSSPTRSEKRGGSPGGDVPVPSSKSSKQNDGERKRSSDSKRILFKCKRCNYRDASKENLHQHVKEHFKEQYKQQQHQQRHQSDYHRGEYRDATAPVEDALVPGTSASYSSQDLSLRGTSPDRDERHCRLKHSGDIRVVSNRNSHEKLEVDDQQQQQQPDDDGGPFESAVHLDPSPPPEHKKPVAGPYACTRCTYNVTKRQLLLEHWKVHGDDDGGGDADAPDFDDPPLVWVSRNGKFSKMFKCRFCPHVNVRKVNVHEHEKMHGGGGDDDVVTDHRCPECDYVCNNAGVLSSHAKVHRGLGGTIHRLVDPARSDEEQLRELHDVDVQEDDVTLRFCGECPARFLKRAEFDIHETLHGAPYPFRCPSCTYAAEEESYLQTHENVHGDEYQRRSDALSETHDVCADHPRPSVERVGVGGPFVVARNMLATVPISGTELFRQREALAASASDTLARRGNPDFVYATYVKNGRAKEKRYKCHKCPTAFEKREQYKVHLGLHGSRQRYSCDACDYSVKYYANYVQHVKKHRTSDDAQQQLAQRPKAAAPQDRKLFWCASCPYASGRKDAVENHQKRHGSASVYTCDHCDYSVPQAHFLRDHARLHFAQDGGTTVRPTADGYMVCDDLRLTSGAGLVFSGSDGEAYLPAVSDDVAERFNNNAGEKRRLVNLHAKGVVIKDESGDDDDCRTEVN